MALIESAVAVIPSVAAGGVLSLLAMLFPAVFGGLTGQLKRWLALITVTSLNSTFLFVYFGAGPSPRGSWWGTPAAPWVVFAALAALGVLWAWRRQLSTLARAPAGEVTPDRPGRGECVLLWVLSLAGVGFLGLSLWQEYRVTGFVLALWIGIWVGTAYVSLASLRDPKAGPTLSTEGVILGATVPASLLGLTGATTTPSGGRVGRDPVEAGVPVISRPWTFRPPGHGFIVSSPLVTDTRVYIAVAHNNPIRPFGTVYGLDAATGRPVWEFSDDGRMKEVFSSPCLADGRLYVGEGLHQDANCKLYCLDADTGRKLWAHRTAGHTESSPVVAAGKVFCGAGDDGVYCLDAATGEERWHFRGSYHIDAPPLVFGDRVYVGAGVGDLHRTPGLLCLNAGTGDVVWALPTELPVWNAPAHADGHLYAGLGNGNYLRSAERPAGSVLCVRAEDGKRIWNIPLPDAVLCRPAVRGDVVAFVSRDGHGYGLGRADGRRLWRHDLGAPAVSSPALAAPGRDRGAFLYLLGSAGRLSCLDPNAGEVFWTLQVGGKNIRTLSSPAVWQGAGGPRRVYVGGGTEGNGGAVLYCLEDHGPAE